MSPAAFLPNRRQSGISLVIVLMLLVIIGITSAAAIRSAVTDQKVVNNMRSETLAQNYAEAALRFCETELTKASADRIATLQEFNITTTTFAMAASPLWNQASSWSAVGGAASLTVIPLSAVRSTDSSANPSRLPECMVERQELEAGGFAYVITARGFSFDYQANTTTGITEAGSVVWLQSILSL